MGFVCLFFCVWVFFFKYGPWWRARPTIGKISICDPLASNLVELLGLLTCSFESLPVVQSCLCVLHSCSFIKNQLVPTEVSFQAEALLNETPNFYCLASNVLWLQTVVRISVTSETFIPLNYPLFGCVCINSCLCYADFHLFSAAQNWLCYANTFFGF